MADLVLNHLSKTYTTAAGSVNVLRDVQLELNRGEAIAITGPSGSGKSLFLRMIADLDPNEGEIWLDGRERASMPSPASAATIAASIERR